MARKRAIAKKQAVDSESAAPAKSVIVFDGSLDIAGAGRLREQLLQALTGKQPVVLDAANVERVDTAALQVLTAFFKDAGAQNLDVQWKEPAQALKNAARLLGLRDSLCLN
jgi:anti-anti-sigma regulatory factor